MGYLSSMFKIILTFILFSFFNTAHAVDPTHNWQSVETDHFYIHFAKGSEALAKKVAAIAENAHAKLSPAIDWVPEEKTHLVLSDETDQPNGFVVPIPFNRSVLFISPPDTNNTIEDYDDWLDTLITHEYAHVLHLDKVTGLAKRGRSVFGRHFLLFPNIYQPAWLIEGLATYYETDEELGIGRGQSSLFNMMMRMEVENGVKPISQVNLRILSWPMGTTAYLYGVHFYQFIEQRYGKEAIKSLVDNYSNNIIPFSINTNARQVLKKDMTALWNEFDEWLQKKYKPQLKDIEQQGIVKGEAITEYGYFTGSVNSRNKNQTYYIKQGAFSYPALMSVDDKNKHSEIAEVHRGARMDVHTDKGVLLAQPEYCDEYNNYYDLYIIKHNGKKLKRITRCGRYRNAAWSADGAEIIAAHIDNGISQLHILNSKGEKQSVVWQGKDSEVIGQLDWSSEGDSIVASVFRSGAGWNIELFDLNTRQWKKITNDSYIDMQPKFNAKGDSIVFSSDRSGIYNIYRYSIKQKSLTQLTRVKSGAFQPAQWDEKSPLYYVGYSASGTDIVKLNIAVDLTARPIEVVASRLDVNKQHPEVSISAAKDYSPWSSIRPRWWSPHIFMNQQQKELGFITFGNDALGIHNYSLQLAYDAENKYAVGGFSYRYSNRIQLGFARSTDIFLQPNGDFNRARITDDTFFTLAFPHTREKTRWNFILGAISSTTSDARLGATALPVRNFKDNILGAAITVDNAQRHIRSISVNNGRRIRLIAETSEVINSDFSGEVFILDWREYIPLAGQHVLAIRAAKGYGTEQPEPFRLGGEENNFNAGDIIFNTVGGEPLFDRREYALRGFAEGHAQLTGRRMQMANIEWRFPLDLVERGFMAPPLGLIQYSGSMFVDTGASWNEGQTPEKYYTGAGLELHADVSLFYGVNLRMRLGAAKGLDRTIGDERIYFSLGASF